MRNGKRTPAAKQAAPRGPKRAAPPRRAEPKPAPQSRPAPKRAQQKRDTHLRIVASAGKLVRRRGLAAASVGEVMRGAGLTQGGFYAHFRDKGAMDAEVLRVALGELRASWFAGLEGADDPAWLARVVKRYLSPAHRDAPDTGCPLPASLSELPRASPAVRATLVEGLELAARELAAHAPRAAAASARERALATLALCVGGLTLSRALRGLAVSDELIDACVVWALQGPGRRKPGRARPRKAQRP